MKSNLNSSVLNIPAKLYRIGELVSYTPFSRQTIHNYTIMGLIHEAKWTQGGHRLYDESVFERLTKIGHLRKTKTLEEIRNILCNLTPNREDRKERIYEILDIEYIQQRIQHNVFDTTILYNIIHFIIDRFDSNRK